ncbi:hypothetical protein [Methylorubrum sp. DB1722]|uniref:hypothetical protein n=1 Tax=Methylorubrum sp. DB1722 TaxID=2478916 RepID=UPI0018E30EA7|nr:hypothetical protein [Methylorubrum sp. DB1722]MBI1692069.1 hypothetical protein [Methylorubrum sp. DB1722]
MQKRYRDFSPSPTSSGALKQAEAIPARMPGTATIQIVADETGELESAMILDLYGGRMAKRAVRLSELHEGLRMRICRSAEATRYLRTAIVQLAMLQADPGLAGVASGGDHHAVAVRASLRLLSMDAVRLVRRNAHPLSIDLDLAGWRGALNHPSHLPIRGGGTKVESHGTE